jgi:hypothetical protein
MEKLKNRMKKWTIVRIGTKAVPWKRKPADCRRRQEKEIHKCVEVITVRERGSKEDPRLTEPKQTSCLLLEETAELVHHAAAAAAVLAAAVLAGGTAVRTTLVAGAGITLVLLDGILSNATDDGSTDCSENAVVGLVACKSTGGTTGESSHQTTLTLLGLARSLLLVISVIELLAWSLYNEKQCDVE